MTKNLLRTTLFTVLSSPFLFLSCDDYSSDLQSKHSDNIEFITLLKTTKAWDGTTYTAYPTTQPEISVLKIIIPPNSTLNWHKHPVINVAYVEEGEIKVERKEDGKTQWIKKGQALGEVVNTIHRGKTGKQAATLIVFYSGTPGTPLSEPLK